MASTNSSSRPNLLPFVPDTPIDPNQSSTMGIPVPLETWMRGPDDALYIDFERLAHIDEAWRKVYQKGQPNFKDPQVGFILTTSTLRALFRLEVRLPMDRLCPTIPSRFQYIQFLQRLVDTTGRRYLDRRDEERTIVGFDIGVGSSCIYPLLGCSTRKEWKFIGFECDEKNLAAAQHNIDANNHSDNISLIASDPLVPTLLPLPDTLDDLQHLATFTMCNPPFYSSPTEMLQLAAAKPTEPHGTNTGTAIELCCPGGEAAFVTRHFADSTRLRAAVQWYTTLVGRHDTIVVLITKFREQGVDNWVVVPIQAGHVTRRWIVAWSWEDLRPPVGILGAGGTGPGRQMSWWTESRVAAPPWKDARETFAAVDGLLGPLELVWEKDGYGLRGVAQVYGNVWDRGARRRRERGESVLSERAAAEMDAGGVPLMVAKVGVVGGEVVVRWMRGKDRGLFDSFVGLLSNALKKL